MRHLLLGLLLCLSAVAETDVSGKWIGGPFVITFKAEGNKLTGTAGQTSSEQFPLQDPAIDGDHITFRVGAFKFDLHVAGAAIKGEMNTANQPPTPVTLVRAESMQSTTHLAFDVASVKHSASNGPGMSNMRLDPGRLTCSGVTLKTLFRRAYSVKEYQVTGPDWLDTERYEITATFPGTYGVDQVTQMLQNLLAERFKVTVRHESKEMPVYGLVVGKGGHKMTETEIGPGGTSSNRGKMTGTRIPMSKIAEFLSNQVDRPVIDMTGVSGVFNLTLEWAPDPNHIPENGPTADIYSAIQQQLGLKLESHKAPVDVLVIEHAEKDPTENL